MVMRTVNMTTEQFDILNGVFGGGDTNSALVRAQQALSNMQGHADRQWAEVRRLMRLDEHEPEFNPEYHFDLHMIDGPGGLKDDPRTDPNEGFTMGNVEVKKALIEKAMILYSDWYLPIENLKLLIKDLGGET